jgi:hypothetical protein
LLGDKLGPIGGVLASRAARDLDERIETPTPGSMSGVVVGTTYIPPQGELAAKVNGFFAAHEAARSERPAPR